MQLIVIFYSQCASYGTEKYPISEKCRNQAAAVSDVIIEAFSEIKLVANIIHVVEALIESVDRNEFIIDMLTKTFNDSKLELSGREIDIANGIAQVLNFSVEFIYVSASGALHANGSSTGTFNMLLEDKVDFIIGNNNLKPNRLKFIGRPTSHLNRAF